MDNRGMRNNIDYHWDITASALVVVVVDAYLSIPKSKSPQNSYLSYKNYVSNKLLCKQYEHNNSYLNFVLDNTIFVWLSWFVINWLLCFCCFLREWGLFSLVNSSVERNKGK